MSMRMAFRTLLMCLVLAPAVAHGQGFGVYEQGACVMSRGGAGVADPCDDGSAIYVNPAGLTGRKGLVFGGGGTLIFGSGSFTSDLGTTTSLIHSGWHLMSTFNTASTRQSRLAPDSTRPTGWA